MSTTMIVCLIIIGICTLVIIVSKVYELIQTVKLEEANKLLIGLKSNITDHDGVKYAKWLPYCPDYFGYTEDFECANCHNLSKMPVVNGEICYFEYCPHCGMKMMYKVGEP